MGSGGSVNVNVNSGKKAQNYTTLGNTRNAVKNISSETIVIVENKSVTKEDLNENSPNADQSKSRGNEDLAEVKPKQDPEWYLAWISDDSDSQVSQSDPEDNLRFERR